MNKVILIGNLTKDPEVRSTNGGVSVCSFTVAVQRRFANAQGVREADFINCVSWRQTADFIGRYFTKGKKISVVGSLQTRSYDAQDGSKRFVTEVVAEDVEFVTPLNDGSARPRTDDIPLPSEPAPAAVGQPTQMTEADDDELPF